MTNRLTRAMPAAPWLTLGGTVALLVGLSWDVVLHRLDRSLAAREGVLTLTNPGHALVAGGLGLTVAGSVLFLSGRVAAWDGRSARQRLVLRLGLTSFLALVVASIGLSAWSGVSLSVSHAHADHGVAGVAAETCTGAAMLRDGHTAAIVPHRHAQTPTDSTMHSTTHHGMTGVPDTAVPDAIDAHDACTTAAHHD